MLLVIGVGGLAGYAMRRRWILFVPPVVAVAYVLSVVLLAADPDLPIVFAAVIAEVALIVGQSVRGRHDGSATDIAPPNLKSRSRRTLMPRSARVNMSTRGRVKSPLADSANSGCSSP